MRAAVRLSKARVAPFPRRFGAVGRVSLSGPRCSACASFLAHDRAVATFRTVYSAFLAQFALLALMVLYTVGGLWILSQG